MKTYQTDDLEIALKRIGKGVCPKSFNISRQSYYYLDLYRKTHGGDYGIDLTHLPLSGGVLEQPNIFFAASDIISSVRSQHFSDKIDREREDNVHRQANSGEGNQGQAVTSLSGGR